MKLASVVVRLLPHSFSKCIHVCVVLEPIYSRSYQSKVGLLHHPKVQLPANGAPLPSCGVQDVAEKSGP